MKRIRVPQQPGEITPELLTQVLRSSGALPNDAAVRGISLDDPGREASYAGYVTRLAVDYEPDRFSAPRTMIAKLPAPERLIRILFRTIYRNEIFFYRHMARGVSIPVPKRYAALINRRQSRSFLLLQDLTDIATPGDHDAGCTFEQARIALTRLAGLHASWWEDPALESIEWLGHYRVDSTKNWMIYAGAWLPFQYRLRHITPHATLTLFRNLWRYRDQLQRLEAGRPRSLQHGDFRLANLAFTEDDVYVFDWQVVRTGPPLFDVAWFMLTSLTVEQRRTAEVTLLRAYNTALIDAGVSNYQFEDLMRDYRLALLLTIPQIMVIGAFLRIDPAREVMLGKLLQRFDAARGDHELERVLGE